jgi:hypothetical protein
MGFTKANLLEWKKFMLPYLVKVGHTPARSTAENRNSVEGSKDVSGSHVVSSSGV